MIFYCGIFSFGNQKDLIRDTEVLNASVSFNFKDLHKWSSDNIYVAQKNFSFYPENQHESLPLHHNSYGLVIVGDIRLDNRKEILSLLDIYQNQNVDISDAQLVVELYKSYKEDCALHLLGDFAFAIYDQKENKLFCCRDHLGTRPFLYFHQEKKFLFSSRPTEMLAVEGVDRGFDVNKMASLIYPPMKHISWEKHWCSNILYLPAGSYLVFDAEGTKIKKYWTPSLGKELNFRNEDEYREAFQEVIFRAVGDRMRSSHPVSALLSGGLDSSAVVAVAAKILEKQNKTLHTFSAVLPDPNDKYLRDERFYIDQFKSFPNIQINYVTAPNLGFFSDMQSLEREIVPPILNSRHFFYSAFVEEAKKIGSQIILDGSGGELGVSYHGYGIYSEMFLSGKWVKLHKEINARRSIRNSSYHRIFLGEIIKPFIRKTKQFELRVDNNCLQDDYVRTLLEVIKTSEKDIKQPAISSFRSRLNQLELIKSQQNKAQGTYSYDGVDFRFPLKDKRLLEFCLNSPAHFKLNNGYYRNIVRIGLSDLLPEQILWRTSKAPMNVDYNRRFKAQMPDVLNFLNSISVNDPICRIVDVYKLKEWTKISLADDEAGTKSEQIALNLLPGAIYLIYFLRHFKEFKN